VIVQAVRGKFLREFLRYWRAGETPQQVIASGIMLMREDGELNAAVVVKGMHRVESFPKATGRYGSFYDKRKIASDGLLTAGHLCSDGKVGHDHVETP
jgi:hypothetical protein